MTGLLLIVLVLMPPLTIGAIILFAPGSNSAEEDVLDSQSLEESEDPATVLKLAEKQENEGDYRGAIEAWSRYQQLREDDPAGFFRRSINWHRIDEHERALDDLETVESLTNDPPRDLPLYRAKCYAALDQEDEALTAYETYLKQKPEDLSAWEPVADWATRNGHLQRARNLWDHIRETADSPRRERANLKLAEIDIQRGQPERAREILDTFDEKAADDSLETIYRYTRGRLLELEGKTMKATNCYRDVYETDPEFRDVADRIPEDDPIRQGKDPIDQYRNLPTGEFRDLCESMARDLGYEIMESEVLNDQEVVVKCRDSGGMNIMNVDRYLMAFKRWENAAGQMAVKDFEMNLVEDRFDYGYFINPGGFKHSARQLAEGNPDLELFEPEELLTQLEADETAEERRQPVTAT